mgnify:FL=1
MCLFLAGLHFTFQVRIFAQWLQWLHHTSLRGNDSVVVNIDESALTKCLPPRRGYNFFGLRRPSAHRAAISNKETRSHSTLLACIAADPDLQPHLPQFILTKDANLSRAEKDRLDHLPAPLSWVKGSQGWVTAINFKDLLTALRRKLRELRPGNPIVLIMDCACQHTQSGVLAHASRLGLHVVLVPAGLTWLLQPLDSHTFATFKATLARKQTAARAATEHGCMLPAQWVDVASATIQEVLVHRSWAPAFVDNGLVGGRPARRARIQDELGQAFPLPLTPPDVNDIKVLTGSKSIDMRRLVLAASLRAAVREEAMPPAAAPFVIRAVPLVGGVVARAARLLGAGVVAAEGASGPASSSAGAGPVAPARHTRSGSFY